MVGVAYAEDGELGLGDGVAGAPVERDGAALGVDVSGRPVGEQLIVAALDVGALGSAGEDFDVGLEVGGGDAAGLARASDDWVKTWVSRLLRLICR